VADAEALLARLEHLLQRAEGLLPPAAPVPDWSALAFRWRRDGGRYWMESVPQPHRLRLGDLLCMDEQKAEIVRNTEQFMAGRPANNVLLWGSRGTGKSSLIKAVFDAYCERGLRLIEVEKQDLMDLPAIVECIRGRPERFVIFCDDLSFEADDASYKALKAVLDGSIIAPPNNLLLYASSNRRHLLPEFQRENREARMVDGEIHHAEAVEEKISLSERFGLWLSFYPFSQAQYLRIVHHWLASLGGAAENPGQIDQAALQWALKRGSRSGRVAWQFARDWAGRAGPT
jgi:predicted AAA+ superfamily ATPase